MTALYATKPMDKNTGKLVRQAKVFLRVDREGYLTDTQTVSDVVSFDCHESVVSSLQRILAVYNNTTTECIGIESMFYYKRRHRSNRMNPSIIRTTTDVFRAIAEHPSGDVPIGVVWTKKIKIGGPAKVVVKMEPDSENPVRVLIPERKRNSPSTTTLTSSDPNEPQEKIRKIDSSYKTYMPGGEGTSETIKVTTSSRQTTSYGSAKTHVSMSADSPQTYIVTPTVPVVNPTSRAPEYQPRTTTEQEENSKYPYKSEYQWPDDVTCEVVLNYDGISERKTLRPGIAYVVQSLLKGNYNVLSNDVAHSLKLNKFTGKRPLEVLDEINRISKQPLSKDIQEDLTQRAPIKYLQDAKSEIFKVMSLLNLSKSRFKQLLKWMKSLRLEEGKRGKFYLSERNNISKGMQVCYDTNEEAAMKLNHIYKSARSSPLTKVLHPLDTNPLKSNVQVQPLTGIQTVGDATKAPPLVYLLPNVSQSGQVNNLQPCTVTVNPTINQAVMTSSANSVPQVPTSQGLFEVRNKSILVPVSSIQTPGQEETSTKQRSHSLPRILKKKMTIEKKTDTEPPPSPNTEDPTPMHLFRSRSYKSVQESEDQRSDAGSPKQDLNRLDTAPQDNVLTVKEEPVDYTSDTADGIEQTPGKSPSPSSGLYDNKRKDFKDVLKLDAQMPQSSEQTEKPFDMDNIVVKSEPIDDF